MYRFLKSNFQNMYGTSSNKTENTTSDGQLTIS